MVKRSVWEQVQEEFACEHSETEIRKLIQGDNRIAYVRQCLCCGHNGGAVKKENVPGRLFIQPGGIPLFEESLRQNWRTLMADRLEHLRQSDSDHWWRDYNRYLESPEWKARRVAVLERDHFVCQGCQRNRATQAHHINYQRVGREMLFDLVAVCDDCHEAIHEEK